jgi:hypothetical protein
MGRALAKPIIFSREKLIGFASLYPSYALQNFFASAPQAARTAALRSSRVAARATLGAIKAMTIAMFRILNIVNSDICLSCAF